MEYSFHPAADEFPLMDSGRFAELLADIRANGLLQPIVLYGGQILDGRNRYRACREANVEPQFISYVGNPFAYAWSVNGQRRDLVQDQRYIIWKRCQKGSEAWRQAREQTEKRANKARSEAAKAGKVGRVEGQHL